MDDTPALEQLGGAYFHQDWPDDFETPEEVVVDYLKDEPQSAPELLSRVNGLISSDLDEAQLDAVLEEAGFCYDPTRDGKTNRSWLQDIARIAARHIPDRPADQA